MSSLAGLLEHGITSRLANDVCRRFCASNGEIRTSRWTPRSADSSPYAYGPWTMNVALLMPASSPGSALVDLDVEALALGPAQVHPQEHLGPVLRLGPAGAGMQRGDRVVVVVLAAEQRRELELLHIALELSDGAGELGRHLAIGLILEELVHRSRVLEPADQRVVAFDLGPQAGERRGQLLAAGGVVPERRIRRIALELARLRSLVVDVKGTPWPTRCAWRGRRALGVVAHGPSHGTGRVSPTGARPFFFELGDVVIAPSSRTSCTRQGPGTGPAAATFVASPSATVCASSPPTSPTAAGPLLTPTRTLKPSIPHAASTSPAYAAATPMIAQRRARRTFGVVLVRGGDAEVRADPVAHEGLDHPAEVLDGAAHPVHALADERLDLVGPEAFAEPGRPRRCRRTAP